jgi:outer membrane protein OmpA-like peptidoglycan-associated protein
MKAFVPQAATIATLGTSIQTAPSQTYDVPAAPEANAPTRTALILPWQANGSLVLANGGTGDAQGTLMQKFAGANLKLQRQDDYGKMADSILKFATDFKSGNADQSTGAAYVSLMGGGEAAWLAGLKPQMDKLGLHLKVFGVTGFSYGEDKCMAPDTGGDPQKAKGDLIAASPRDGDWDVCVKWAGDNGIPVNSDGTSYDPGALNFVDTDGFQTADDDFINGLCQDRNEVKAGVKTGKKVHVCVNGVATWTPGDVTVMEKKGGVVTLASTKLYDQQMPAVLIGIKEEMDKHPAFVTGMLRAVDRAAFQIRTTPDGVHQMAVAEAKVFGTAGGAEADPNYWAKYFVGYDSADGKVKLGGSRVSTLAEVRDFLGLGQGTFNIYKGVYEVFGKYDVAYYPTTVPSVPKYEDVIDTDYQTAALQGVTMGGATEASTQFQTAKTITTTVSSKAVSVQFDTGKATIRPESRAVLDDIANSAAETNLLIRISGHTDNTGDADSNVALSRARAQAVADALTKMAPANFPATRFEIRGYGGDKPIADNSTAEGRQANRRVEIVLGN